MSNFILKFLFRTFSCLFLACCVFVTFVPLKDMTTLIKEKKPLWMIKMSQVWGGSVSEKDHTLGNRTTIQWASVTAEDPDIISFLVKKGANVNESSASCQATPLLFALEQNKNPKIAQRLLELGADANQRIEDGRTLFHVAVVHTQSPELLDSFKEHGADIFATDFQNKADALHWAADHNNNLEIIKKLMSFGLRIESLDGVNRTPLIKAASVNQNPEILKFMLENGAFIDAQDNNWETPLIIGCRRNTNPDVLTVLLDYNANVHLFNNHNRRAIDYARENPALRGSAFLKRLETLSQKK